MDLHLTNGIQNPDNLMNWTNFVSNIQMVWFLNSRFKAIKWSKPEKKLSSFRMAIPKLDYFVWISNV
jgi:hypothetical protein